MRGRGITEDTRLPVGRIEDRFSNSRMAFGRGGPGCGSGHRYPSEFRPACLLPRLSGLPVSVMHDDQTTIKRNPQHSRSGIRPAAFASFHIQFHIVTDKPIKPEDYRDI